MNTASSSVSSVSAPSTHLLLAVIKGADLQPGQFVLLGGVVCEVRARGAFGRGRSLREVESLDYHKVVKNVEYYVCSAPMASPTAVPVPATSLPVAVPVLPQPMVAVVVPVHAFPVETQAEPAAIEPVVELAAVEETDEPEVPELDEGDRATETDLSVSTDLVFDAAANA